MKGRINMERYFESVNCKNIKEIVYNSAKKFAENVAFVIKHKNEKKEVSYESITYKKLLQDVNEFGTKLYDMGLKNKRVAIVGRNRYEWVVAHLSNLLGGIVSIPLASTHPDRQDSFADFFCISRNCNWFSFPSCYFVATTRSQFV